MILMRMSWSNEKESYSSPSPQPTHTPLELFTQKKWLRDKLHKVTSLPLYVS
jgi:hypothetical protein